MKLSILLILLIIPGSVGIAYGHTVDAVGEYRVEIGWMNEPVVSGETNAIEFYVSPMNPCPEIPEPIKCAESQEFQNGVEGLKKTVKMQLIYRDESITLPLSPDHDIPGKYYAFVNPTVSGFYQANMLGSIKDTPISLSMHPPKVEERPKANVPDEFLTSNTCEDLQYLSNSDPFPHHQNPFSKQAPKALPPATVLENHMLYEKRH